MLSVNKQLTLCMSSTAMGMPVALGVPDNMGGALAWCSAAAWQCSCSKCICTQVTSAFIDNSSNSGTRSSSVYGSVPVLLAHLLQLCRRLAIFSARTFQRQDDEPEPPRATQTVLGLVVWRWRWFLQQQHLTALAAQH